MVVIVCVDDRYGMLFNHRRQSSDSAVVERILSLTDGKRLWMNSYSQSVFPENAELSICEDFMKSAPVGDYCFLENRDVRPYLDCVEKFILFRWNRKYPFDLSFPVGELEKNWRLNWSEDFRGNSHECITMEVYCR